MSLDGATIARLTALAETDDHYVAVDVDELRTLCADHPEDATLQAWAKHNGAATGMKRIARVTLRQLLGLPFVEPSTKPDLHPATRIKPPPASDE